MCHSCTDSPLRHNIYNHLYHECHYITTGFTDVFELSMNDCGVRKWTGALGIICKQLQCRLETQIKDRYWHAYNQSFFIMHLFPISS